jgi:hypothetical protein
MAHAPRTVCRRTAAAAAAGSIFLIVLSVLAPAAASGAARVTTTASCTMADRVDANGVRVRTAPNLSAAVVGQLNFGTEVTSNCDSVLGAKYTACGFTEYWWVPVISGGHWRYMPAACLTPLVSLPWT